MNIGLAALYVVHLDPSDYSKGTRKKIVVGQPFRLANAVFVEKAGDARPMPLEEPVTRARIPEIKRRVDIPVRLWESSVEP